MNHSPTLQFLGAARSVTGSKYLLQNAQTTTLIDCGLFQGLKELRLRNWQPLPFYASEIDQVILTHAHIDHTGYLPRLVKEGFQGPIYCTPATAELLSLLLPDCARIQEEDASYAAKKGYSKHEKPLPLFTSQDAQDALQWLRTIDFGKKTELRPGLQAQYHPTGHILGSGSLELEFDSLRILFSGDLGRFEDKVMNPPCAVDEADYLLIEATYGDRLHPPTDVSDELSEIIRRTYEKGGMLLIPAFALGRTQILLYHIHQLQKEGKIPRQRIFVDSPMAVDTSSLYCKYGQDANFKIDFSIDGGKNCILYSPGTSFVRTVDESKQINDIKEPAIVISASGMATGGRVLHHLARRLPDPRNTILLVGYQAEGTRGQLLRDGAQKLKMHGREIPVKAEIANISGLSAHGDQADLMKWLSAFRKPPRMTFLVHGELNGLNGLHQQIQQHLGWSTHIPNYLEKWTRP